MTVRVEMTARARYLIAFHGLHVNEGDGDVANVDGAYAVHLDEAQRWAVERLHHLNRHPGIRWQASVREIRPEDFDWLFGWEYVHDDGRGWLNDTADHQGWYQSTGNAPKRIE